MRPRTSMPVWHHSNDPLESDEAMQMLGSDAEAGAQGGSGTGHEPPAPPSTPPADPPPPEVVPFAGHRVLAGQSEAAVLAYVQSLEARIAQGAAAPPPAPPSAPPVTEAPPPDVPRFIEDPDAALRAASERAIQGALKTALEPFKAEIEAQRRDRERASAEQARAGLRAQFPDFEAHEPYMEQAMAHTGKTLETMTALELQSAYFMTKGFLSSKGVELKPTNNGSTAAGAPAPVVPPQNRPSGAPTPPPPNAGKKPTLTEEERQMARIQRMTDEEYITMRDQQLDEVLSSAEKK